MSPNLSPPFAHPFVPTSGGGTLVRAHNIGSNSPSYDTAHYILCAHDLFNHYRKYLQDHPCCPLIVNCPGWVLGTGLEIMIELIKQMQLTHVVYMSVDGPLEVVDALKEAARLKDALFETLPNQQTLYVTRTPFDLRTMQMLSYFHCEEVGAELSWNPLPLTSLKPWVVRYAGKNPGMHGVFCAGEKLPADVLSMTLDGSVVAVVVVDDYRAVPGVFQEHFGSDVGSEDDDYSEDEPESVLSHSRVPIHAHNSLSSRRIPAIIRTPEGIPYVDPFSCNSIDPRYSQTLGLALVRGIDVKNSSLHLLTPIRASYICDLGRSVERGEKKVLLLRGSLDYPTWAYTEELRMKMKLERKFDKQTPKDGRSFIPPIGQDEADSSMDGHRQSLDVETRMEDRRIGEGFEDVPWVELRDGNERQHLGVVWRVRRDLGRGKGRKGRGNG
jgi:polynucleotide 5'-hydroxyl-kinase GRC3/NOL9